MQAYFEKPPRALQQITIIECRHVEASVADRAKQLDALQVPAVVVDGQLAECCASGLNEAALREAGVGQPRD